MKIYSMTATFGKLSNQTLTLQPGLNVIHAPNEWGKSTWCAFLVSMLYGIDTKERTTATALAVKEHYAPWSGEPMSGRIDLNWNGRDITVERHTKGRVPMGEFRAYETQSGLPVPELTAANCGQVLLGVERSVFLRAGFMRLTDMPVTQDEALRRRLNALVTTGDESGTADALSQKLRDLRNKCRHNKTGLLPQAEAQRSEILGKLAQLQALQAQAQRIEARQTELDTQIKLLNNHRDALAHAASNEDARRVETAREACAEAEEAYEALEHQCSMLPTKEDAQEAILNLEQLRMDQEALQNIQMPPVPEKPETPPMFAGLTPKQALMQAQSSESAYNALLAPRSPLLLILGIALLAATVPVAALWSKVPAIVLLLAGAALAAVFIRQDNLRKQEARQIAARYGQLPPDQWVAAAQSYCDAAAAYETRYAAYQTKAEELEHRKDALQSTIDSFTFGESINQCIDGWRSTIAAHDRLAVAYQRRAQARQHAQTLAEMAKLAPPPEIPDTLTWSQAETDRLLTQAAAEHKQLHLQLGQCMGQLDTLGQEAVLQSQLEAVNRRIARLEDTYSALTIAMDTLSAATNALQRKFAPRIAQRAQELFGRLTGGRYDRLQLTQELGLNAAATDEIGVQEARWRSEGTVDQLYLSLRLAVAEELTPDAPLILDDALVRFDDTRLAAAMAILQEAAQDKQVILFSCQTRESVIS